MPWNINYTIQDADNHKSRVTFRFNDNLTVDQLNELNVALQPMVKAIIDGGIVSAGAVYDLSIEAGSNTITPASDVEYGGRFIFNVAGGYKTQFRIPTLKKAMVADGGGAVITEGNAVETLITALVSGIAVTAGTATMQDYRGEDVTGLSSALEAHQSQRR